MASTKSKSSPQARMAKNSKDKGRQPDKESKKLDQREDGGPSYSKVSVVGATVMVILAALAYGVQWSVLLGSDIVTLASMEANHTLLRYQVPCSTDYKQETFAECKPQQCGRVVRDNLVLREDAEHLLRLAKRGLSHGGSNGGASILDLHSGALSMGDSFVNIYKIAASDKSLFSEEDFIIYRKVKGQIHSAIAEEFGVPGDKLYLTKPTFFSRMDTTPSHTIHDEYWHIHVDKETYGSFHYTSLLYLSTYKEDFLGGRFTFVDVDGKNRTVEPKLGRVSFFTSGSENPHFVERLKEGVRYAITVSFTCDPSQAIADPTLN